jgi:outer membrane protein
VNVQRNLHRHAKKNCWLQDNAQKNYKRIRYRETTYGKVRASIQKSGKAKGFQYIVDGSSFIADGPNLTWC